MGVDTEGGWEGGAVLCGKKVARLRELQSRSGKWHRVDKKVYVLKGRGQTAPPRAMGALASKFHPIIRSSLHG